MRGPVAIAAAAILAVASAAAAGGLMVTCWPDHRVLVDGVEVGITTVEQDGLLLMDVAPGVRVVRIERDGFLPYEAEVDVPGTGLAELKVPRLVPAVGVLRVTGEVGWRVYLDGQLVGLTSAAGVELADVDLGAHVVRLEKLGRDPVETTVEVTGGEAVEVSAGGPASPSEAAPGPDPDLRAVSTAATAASATAGAQQVGEVTGTRMVEVAPADVDPDAEMDAAEVFSDVEGFSQQPEAANVAFGYRARGAALTAGGAVTVTRERGGPKAPVMVFWCLEEATCTRRTKANFEAGSYRFRVSCRVDEDRAADAHDVFVELDARSDHAYLLDVVWDGDGRQPCTASIVDVSRPTE
jgi:hypothetical protein